MFDGSHPWLGSSDHLLSFSNCNTSDFLRPKSEPLGKLPGDSDVHSWLKNTAAMAAYFEPHGELERTPSPGSRPFRSESGGRTQASIILKITPESLISPRPRNTIHSGSLEN